MFPAEPVGTNSVMMALGLVFGCFSLAGPGVVSSGGVGGGIQDKGRMETLLISFKALYVDVPVTSS